MQILLKALNGRTFPLEVEPTADIEDIREMLQEKLGIPNEEQNIVFHGMQLEDGLTLSDYGIQKDSTLLLLLKIFVTTDVEERVTLFVSPSDTIAYVKTMLGKELYKGKGDTKRYDDLRLSFEGRPLEDGRNLSHYGIKKESQLHLLFQIHVITEDQEGYLLSVSSSDLVANVKAKLGKELNIPHDEQRLIYRDEELEDYRRLGDYKVKKNAVINLLHEFKISVQTLNGKLLHFPVKRQTLVQSVKKMIQDSERLPADEQRLMFKGERFEDEKMLGEYKIAEGKILDLEVLQIINVHCVSGRFQIPTWPSETIANIKQYICTKLNITFDGYRLLFQKQLLSDENTTVAKYRILHGDTLVLEKQITLNITQRDQMYPLTLWPSDTGSDVKRKIEQVHGIKVAEQRLSLDGKQVSDESSLAKLGDHETLSLALDLRRELYARLYSGEIRFYYVWPSDCVQDVKETIAREENVASSDILLLHGRYAVKDDCAVSDLGVSRMSPLQILQRPHGFFVVVWDVEESTASCVQTKMSASVREMKADVCQELGFKNEVVLLFHRNFLLEDDPLLMDNGIVSSTTISLVKRRAPGTTVTAHKSLDCFEICAAATTNENEAKATISEQHDVPANELEIIFTSCPIHEDRRLDELGIGEGSVISPLIEIGEEIHVTVKPAGQPAALVLRLAPTKTITELKQDIEEKIKVPTSNQYLYFKGEMLNNTNQLSDYKISDYSQLTLVCQVHFRVVSHDSQQAELHVEHTMSVEGLKVLLMEELGIPKTRQRLLIEGKELPDSESLWKCVLMPTQPVILAIAERTLMWIFIRWNERIINVSVSPSDMILDVKMKLFEQTGIPAERQLLSYKDEDLQDDRTSLEDYKIPKSAELILTNSHQIDVVVKVTGTKRIAVNVAESATIAEIINEVKRLSTAQDLAAEGPRAEEPQPQDPPAEEAQPAEAPAEDPPEENPPAEEAPEAEGQPEGPPTELRIYFKGQVLVAESRISKCEIQNGSVVTVLPADGMNVKVKSVCGLTTEIKILPNTGLEDVKKAISEKTNLNENLLGIFVGSTEWKDNQKRAWQMNIDCAVTIFVTRSDMNAIWLFATAEGAIKGIVASPENFFLSVNSKIIEGLNLYDANVTLFLDRKS